MTKLSYSEIAGYARGAGLYGDAIAIATAIAMAESGGETTAHNPIPPDDSYGLWQINMRGRLGPDRRQKLGLRSNEDLYAPSVNAKAMAMISGSGGNFKDWSTYVSGKYLLYLNEAKKVAPDAGAKGPDNDGTGGLANINKAIGTLSDPNTWRRVAYVLAGSVLLIMAFIMLTGQSSTMRGAAKIAVKVAK